MTYEVVLSRQAQRYFARLPVSLARRVRDVFVILESDPRPRNARALKGELSGYFRIRVGDIRIVYKPREDIREVRIARIGPRGDIY